MGHKRLFVACAFAICVTSNDLHAVGVSVARGVVTLTGFGDVDLEKTVQHWAENEQKQITGELGLRIELLTEVCGLKEPEVKKLELAVMAVAKRRLSSGKEQLTQFIFESGLVAPAEKPIAVEHENELTPYQAKLLEDGVVQISTRFEKPLDKHPLWKKILKNSLSQEQWAKYQAHRTSRNLAILKVAVSARLAKLNDVVFLTGSEQDELADLIVGELSGKVTLDRPSSMVEAGEITNPYFGKIENLKEHLRPSQFTRLQEVSTKQTGGIGWSK